MIRINILVEYIPSQVDITSPWLGPNQFSIFNIPYTYLVIRMDSMDPIINYFKAEDMDIANLLSSRFNFDFISME
jgi:hypothetical protein